MDFERLKNLIDTQEDTLQEIYSEIGPDKHEQEDYNAINYLTMNLMILEEWAERYDDKNGTNIADHISAMVRRKDKRLIDIIPHLGANMDWDKDDFAYWSK